MKNHYPYQEKVITYHEAKNISNELHRSGKTTVLVSGCYDIVHLGHVRFLFDAKKLGDALFVSVASDDIIRQLKGPDRPVMHQRYRASMLASLVPTDYVIISEEPISFPNRINFKQLMSSIMPDVLAVNSTDKSLDAKRELISSMGGKMAVIDVATTAITSTTEIIEKIKHL